MRYLLMIALLLLSKAPLVGQEVDTAGLVQTILTASLERGLEASPDVKSFLLIDVDSFARELAHATGTARSVSEIRSYVGHPHEQTAEPVDCKRADPPCSMRQDGVFVALRKLERSDGDWLASVELKVGVPYESGVATELVCFRIRNSGSGWSIIDRTSLLRS